MNYDLESALNEYLELLDKEEYFEAHEVLEEAWHPLRLSFHPLRNLVKGLINGAIAFEHIKRNRADTPRKAQTVIASYERYKHGCTPQIEHAELFTQACQKIEQLKTEHRKVFDVLVS
jgi:hypothetical protein